MGNWISADDPNWLNILAKCPHDFYHFPGYVEIEAKRMGGQAKGLLYEEGKKAFFLPIVVKTLPEVVSSDIKPVFDAISPYGYPGPIWSNEASIDIKFQQTAISAINEFLNRQKVCSVFIRLHPILNAKVESLMTCGNIINHGPTVWIDLTLSQDTIWRQTRQTTRSMINKARREGFQAYFDHDWMHLAEFVKIYEETMQSVDADESYMFGIDYFKQLKKALGDNLHLGIVRAPENGEIAAAALFTECHGIIQYYLSGQSFKYRQFSPTRLLLDHVRMQGQERSNKCFHLGGGLGAKEDSLFKFKAGFSKSRSEFRSWRLICNEAKYLEACEKWETVAGASLDSDDLFFPAYRKPI